MRIGELTKPTNCDIEMIRYYERTGLLEELRRNGYGYREYATEHPERLLVIRHCRSLQLGLYEICVLVDLKTDPASGCQSVDALLDGHRTRVRAQIATLKVLEQQLVTLQEQCEEPHSVADCETLQKLERNP